MKVGIVISRYRRTGGLERVAGEWARGLSRRGHEVVVFAQAVEERDDGIRYVRVGGVERPNWLRAGTFPFAAARALRKHPVDIACSFGAAVLAPTVMGTAGPHRAWFEQGLAESPLRTMEGFKRRINPHHRAVLAVERAIAAGGRYERIYATSAKAASDWGRLYRIPSERLGVLENGVNLDEFRFDPAARDRLRSAWGAVDRFVVLTIANEVARKGVDTLIRAFPQVRAAMPEALLVVGGPAGGAQATRIARAAGVEDHVRLIGPLAEPSAAYSAADVFAFPTRYDPWGLVAVESLACGTPVVCSSVAGVAEHIRDGQTGVVFDQPRNPDALSAAILRGASLSAASLSAGRDACRASVEHLAWDRIVERAERILSEVVASRRPQVSTS